MSNERGYFNHFMHSDVYGCELHVPDVRKGIAKSNPDLITLSGSECQDPLFTSGRGNVTGSNSASSLETLAASIAAFRERHTDVAVERSPKLDDIAPELGKLMMSEAASDQELRDVAAAAEFEGLIVPEFEQ